MVAAAEAAGAFDGHDVFGLLHHADHRVFPTGILADAAVGFFRDVEADLAELDFFLHRTNRFGKARHILGIGLQDVEGHPLRGLRADAGKSAELIDQVLDSALVHSEWGAFRCGMVGQTRCQSTCGKTLSKVCSAGLFLDAALFQQDSSEDALDGATAEHAGPLKVCVVLTCDVLLVRGSGFGPIRRR